MIKFLLFCILLVLCWPIALVALILYPLVWLILLPFRIVGIAVGGALELVWAVVFTSYQPTKPGAVSSERGASRWCRSWHCRCRAWRPSPPCCFPTSVAPMSFAPPEPWGQAELTELGHPPRGVGRPLG